MKVKKKVAKIAVEYYDFISIIWDLSGWCCHGKIMGAPETGPVRISSYCIGTIFLWVLKGDKDDAATDGNRQL